MNQTSEELSWRFVWCLCMTSDLSDEWIINNEIQDIFCPSTGQFIDCWSWLWSLHVLTSWFPSRYDPKTDVWTTVASLSVPRDAVGVGLLGDRLYAVGGYDGQSYLGTVESYDAQNNEWAEVCRPITMHTMVWRPITMLMMVWRPIIMSMMVWRPITMLLMVWWPITMLMMDAILSSTCIITCTITAACSLYSGDLCNKSIYIYTLWFYDFQYLYLFTIGYDRPNESLNANPCVSQTRMTQTTTMPTALQV